jgi:ribonuclease-3
MEAAAMDGAALDWKTALQELTAARGLGVPDYAITESGPDHAKSFVATAVVAGRPRGEGVGSSKKEAEQQAAEGAWRVLSAETLEALEPLEPVEPGAPADSA